LLVLDQDSSSGPPRQTHDEVVTKAIQLIVPTFSDLHKRQMSKVGMLFLE